MYKSSGFYILTQRISCFLGQLHQYKIGQWCQYSRNIGFCKDCCSKIFSNDGMCQPRPSICRRRHLDTVDPKADWIDQKLCGLKHQRNCSSCSCLTNPSMPSWVTGKDNKFFKHIHNPPKIWILWAKLRQMIDMKAVTQNLCHRLLIKYLEDYGYVLKIYYL